MHTPLLSAASICSAQVSASFIVPVNARQQFEQRAVDVEVGAPDFLLFHEIVSGQRIQMLGRRVLAAVMRETPRSHTMNSILVYG
ncbi:MAG: hypothetical protein KBD60_12835 [Sterolibacterium sp.]|jgi:acyl-CoA thioesterase FadM|nr:hypothetical protein [Sterolibacterium sp.]